MKPEMSFHDQECVRRLLALKRHECPPQGYFGKLSDEIMARLKSPSPAQPARYSNWRQWWFDFGCRPILLGAYSVSVCGVLLLGIAAAILVRDQPLRAQAEHYPLGCAVLVALPEKSPAPVPAALPPPWNGRSSLNPVVNGASPDNLFNAGLWLKAQPAAYRPDVQMP